MSERKLEFIENGLRNKDISEENIECVMNSIKYIMLTNGFSAITKDIKDRNNSVFFTLCRDKLAQANLFSILVTIINNIEKSDDIGISKLKEVDHRTQNIVFGFVRQCESSLQNIHIPPLISYICLAFYHIPMSDEIQSQIDEARRKIEQSLHNLGRRYSWDVPGKSDDLGQVSQMFYRKAKKKKRCVIM